MPPLTGGAAAGARRSVWARARSAFAARYVGVARAGLGGVLAYHYAELVPHAGEVYGRGGVLPEASLNPGFPRAPTPLYWVDSPGAVTALVALLAAAAVAYAAGWRTRSAAVALWLGSYALFHRNELTLNPSLAFVGLLLLAHAFFPACPPLSIDRWLARRRGEAPAWTTLPRGVAGALWAVTAIAYSFSGLTKLASPSWTGGRAVGLLLTGPLARAWPPTELLAAAPGPLLASVGWALLGLELAYAPVALFARARPWLWAATLAMHAGLALTMNFADISVAMIAFHLALAEPGWFEPAGA